MTRCGLHGIHHGSQQLGAPERIAFSLPWPDMPAAHAWRWYFIGSVADQSAVLLIPRCTSTGDRFAAQPVALGICFSGTNLTTLGQRASSIQETPSWSVERHRPAGIIKRRPVLILPSSRGRISTRMVPNCISPCWWRHRCRCRRWSIWLSRSACPPVLCRRTTPDLPKEAPCR